MKRLTGLFVLLASAIPAGAQRPSADPTYWQDIRPIFRKHCIACHSTRNVKKIEVSGGLALDTFEAVKKGSKRAIIAPGKADKSLLHELLVTADVKVRMPLETDPLSREKIELVKRWIDAGAKEGTPPPEVADAPVKKAPTRKLDVVIPTSAIGPAGFAGIKTTGKLELAMKIGPLAPITAVAFSPDNKLLAAGSYGQIVVWDLAAAKPAKVLTNVLGAVHDLRFSPTGHILAAGGGQPSAKGDVRLFEVPQARSANKGEPWKLLATLRGHDDVVFSVAFNSDGTKLASASFDHSVRLWNVQTHAPLKDFHHHSDAVYAVAFSPNGKQLATASRDRTVQLVDVETGKSVFTFSGMELDVMALAFHPDGKSIISSGFEAGIYWWNAQTGEKIKTQAGHSIAVHELAFSKDGKRIVSAGADRTVRTWDGTAGTVVKVFPVGSSAYSVAISPSGKLVASGSFDGLVRVWDEASARHLVTLMALADDSGDADWLAITPEGYAAGNDRLISQSRWRVGGNEEQRGEIWKSLNQPVNVRRSLSGENLPTPRFDNK